MSFSPFDRAFAALTLGSLTFIFILSALELGSPDLEAMREPAVCYQARDPAKAAQYQRMLPPLR